MILLLLACSTPAVPYTPGLSSISEDTLRAHLRAPGRAPRVYNFWATWCAPCIEELPMLRDYASKHDVPVILVNVDHPAIAVSKVPAFLDEHGLEQLMTVRLDTPDPVGALPRIVEGWPDQIPVTLVVRPDGTAGALFTQMVSEDALDEAVKAAQ